MNTKSNVHSHMSEGILSLSVSGVYLEWRKRIQTEVSLNSKFHIDRREAEVSMNSLLFNNTSYCINTGAGWF